MAQKTTPLPEETSPEAVEENKPSTQADENQLVTFNLGDEEFGFDIMSVQEIIRQPQYSRIPMAPEYVDGVANLRGTILPIIDTRSRFGMPRIPDTDRTRILVVDVEGTKTGLRVDSVRQVTRIQRSDLEGAPSVVREGMSSDFLKGVVKLDGGKRMILSLNPSAVSKSGEALGKSELKATKNAKSQAASLTKSEEKDQSVAQLVTFTLGAEEFAFYMENVREILRVQRPSEIPDTPAHMLGVLTVRGNILPVIDLRVLLGLPNLVSEVIGAAAAVGKTFSEWHRRCVAVLGRGETGKVPMDGLEAIRRWVASVNTSSQFLLDLLNRIRVSNERANRLLQKGSEVYGSGAGEGGFCESLELLAVEISGLLDSFVGCVKDHILEDQRLVVVQSQGQLLALLVDKVREVLNMPKSQIDVPPKSASASGLELNGIAKLEQGKRLIMLLDSQTLIQSEELKNLEGISNQKEAGVNQKNVTRENGESRGEEQFVTFRLGDGEYGIPISKIQEIDRASEMTRIPRAAEYMDGITNLRGEIIPVINARKRFKLALKETDERTRVIIMDLDGTKTGLLVDSVREVLSLPVKDIEPPPVSLSSAIDRQYISAIGKVEAGKRMIVLLDTTVIMKR